MSDYVLKNDGFGEYSDTDGTDAESVNGQKAAEDEVGDTGEGSGLTGATVNKNNLASDPSTDWQARQRRANLLKLTMVTILNLHCIIMPYFFVKEENEGNVIKDSNKDNATKVDKSALLEAPDGQIVFSNEIICSA